MRISDADKGTFPKFAQYVRTKMPELTNVPVIVFNIKKHGSLSKEELRTALQWGAGPLIVIKSLQGYACPTLANYFGCFEPATPTQLAIDIDSVRSFEKDAYGNGSGLNANKQKVFVVGVTLLHELCHLGNFQHGVAEATEQGFAFEQSAYGKTVP